MDRDCGQTQEQLVEVAGDVARLDEASSRHLLGCGVCRRVADTEASLGHLIDRALPPADVDLVTRIISATEGPRRRQRLLALVPVLVSAAVGVTAAVLIGGVPGSSLLGALPGWSSQGWVSLLAAAREWATVVGALARNAPTVVSSAAALAAGLIALGGGAAAIASARRWGAVASWSRRS